VCGIAGILTVDGGADDLLQRAGAMQRALRHRGPDDSGVWQSAAGHASLAHTRLAIIDPTPAAHQPMTLDGQRLTIAFNGQIYNFVELRRELEGKGFTFRSRSDTEVVLRAYDAYGDACVERLRGMFAFAIWDERTRRGLLARDRFGIKPLYYSVQPGRLVFASELRGMLASDLVARTVDHRAAYEYFRTGSVPEPRTLLDGAKSLRAGEVATWHSGHLSIRSYCDLSFQATLPTAEAVSATRAALLESVQHHFIGDVAVGIFLSGGIDSTALLALAHHLGHTNVQTVTMALPGSRTDEVTLARRTARHFGARHDVCEIDAAGARTLFTEYLDAMDQPSIDGMNTLAVSKLARACGMKVMLSGVGADELFGGYPSVYAVPKFAAWNRRLAATGALRTAAHNVLQRVPDPRWRRVGDMLGQKPSLATSYAAYRGAFTRAEAKQLTTYITGSALDLDDTDEEVHQDPTPQDGVCRLEMTRYLRNQLLRDTDVMSMSCGVEVRVPFLDGAVVDRVTTIRADDRLSEAKLLLRRAVPEIPEWIATQPKRGFMFPIEDWLLNGWSGMFSAPDRHSSLVTGPWYRKWCVHAFEEWMRRNGLTSPVVRDTAASRPRPRA
jgi:asparagine synthase (glutamine-hydrolysing)